MHFPTKWHHDHKLWVRCLDCSAILVRQCHHHHQSSVDGVEEAAATCWAQSFLSFISLIISCSSSSMSFLMVSGYVILCLPRLLQPPVGVQKTRCATGWSAVRKQWPAKLSRLAFIFDVMRQCNIPNLVLFRPNRPLEHRKTLESQHPVLLTKPSHWKQL